MEIKERSKVINLALKKVKKLRKNRHFDLKQSVFSNWAVNLDIEYRKCFEADMKYSKIRKFIKESEIFNEIS